MPFGGDLYIDTCFKMNYDYVYTDIMYDLMSWPLHVVCLRLI